MILSYSRHRFVRFVFRQDSPTWLDCHMRAFSFFRGCPRLLVLDNLKDGVLKPESVRSDAQPGLRRTGKTLWIRGRPGKSADGSPQRESGEMCAGGASADPGGASFSGYRGGQRESSGVVSQGSRSARAWHHPSQTLRGVCWRRSRAAAAPAPINPTKRLSGNNAPCIGTAI